MEVKMRYREAIEFRCRGKWRYWEAVEFRVQV